MRVCIYIVHMALIRYIDLEKCKVEVVSVVVEYNVVVCILLYVLCQDF